MPIIGLAQDKFVDALVHGGWTDKRLISSILRAGADEVCRYSPAAQQRSGFERQRALIKEVFAGAGQLLRNLRYLFGG